MVRKNELRCLYSATPISLYDYDLAIEHAIHKTLKFFKEFKYFRFMMKKVKSHKFTKIINKADMIFFISKGVNGDCKLEHDILLSLMTQRTMSREGWPKRQCHR
jgi:hypothetical protein